MAIRRTDILIVMAGHEPIWTREPAPAAPALSRDRIVAAAIALADADGLDAVSIRRVAAELGARPMSLYAHIASKDDLLELMHDAVVAESLLGDVPHGWQEALRAIARTTRAAVLRHPWILATLGDRPRFGPATLRHVDESVAAVSGLDADDDTRRTLMLAVDTYTIGYLTVELSGRMIRRRITPEEDAAWRAAAGEYARTRIEAGELPNLAGQDLSDFMRIEDADATFEQGLDWLLRGAAAQLEPGG